MTPDNFFEQAKVTLNLPANTPLQSAYQFGVDADTLADLGIYGQIACVVGIIFVGWIGWSYKEV